ncbi:MAG: FAD-dependent 5-carboxymethylaminomethyl-2-thiouridine(34) oxidoreductase MnmC [Methylophilaceae bacterium]
MSLNKIPKKAIVIGGGIAGCSTAYALAKRGIAVALIERHTTIAEEASGNPVAVLYPKFNAGVSLQNEVASHGFTFTLSLLKQLLEQSSKNNDIYNFCGLIQLTFNKREQENQRKLLDSNEAHHFQALSAAEASDKANTELNVGGLYLPESGWVNPRAFCKALINNRLITTVTSNTAISINKTTASWQVLLEKELGLESDTLEADFVVICNANDIKRFDPCKNMPITPVRGQVNFFADNQLSEKIKTVICSDHYLSPSVNGIHSIGTSYTPNDLNPSLSSHDTQANLQALKSISPALFDSINAAAITGRVAWRSATKDYLPLAGQLIDEAALRKASLRYDDSPDDLPWLKGLYVNAGHGSKGMITAPMCGELIANLISNEALIVNQAVAAKLNPNRFLLKDLGLKKMAHNLYDAKSA